MGVVSHLELHAVSPSALDASWSGLRPVADVECKKDLLCYVISVKVHLAVVKDQRV